MSTSTIEQEARAIIEAENKARLDAAVHAVAERRERERQAAEHAAKIEAIKAELVALQDTTDIENKADAAGAAIDALVSAMTARNDAIATKREALQALGDLPAAVELYPYHGGLVIGEVVVQRQRPISRVATLARTKLREHITRGNINLEQPGD